MMEYKQLFLLLPLLIFVVLLSKCFCIRSASSQGKMGAFPLNSNFLGNIFIVPARFFFLLLKPNSIYKTGKRKRETTSNLPHESRFHNHPAIVLTKNSINNILPFMIRIIEARVHGKFRKIKLRPSQNLKNSSDLKLLNIKEFQTYSLHIKLTYKKERREEKTKILYIIKYTILYIFVLYQN